MVKKMPLAVYDRLRHPEDGFESLLDVANQPFRLLQLRRELLIRRVAIAGEDVGIDAVQPQLGHCGIVERRNPLAPYFPYDHVRDAIVRLGPGKRSAGTWIEACDQCAHATQLRIVYVQQTFQLAEIARGK